MAILSGNQNKKGIIFMKIFSIISIIFLSTSINLISQSIAPNTFILENSKVKCTVRIEKNQIISDRLETQSKWEEQVGSNNTAAIETDADFAIDVMYTDWSAPGKINNADNPVMLTKKDFYLVNQIKKAEEKNYQELVFDFKGKETSIELRITYQLFPEAFYVKRNIAVMDTVFGHHFLRWFWTRNGNIYGAISVIKDGGFGQPIAVLTKNGGAFFGVEYPAAENQITSVGKNYNIRCGQEYGERIGSNWLQSDWIVEGITPNQYVKFWFSQYLDDIRIAPLRPYSLYNTWYDLRSPEYPKWSPEKAMSEQTALKMVDILRKSMIEKYNIKLDAFVLDDGWDVYESDWVLRKEQWSRGLKPLADELKKTNTSLGVWFGPTGGYSFRMKRVNWMKDHGYEIVGKTRDNLMLCLAGKNYSELFKKRVTDFVVNDGVGYYKWDGIQFSCSEPNHGHPIDIYSRRAVMESVAEKCKAVREKNPDIFLNITSGTWLSPWWVKYANTIWMQGMDYGFSDVPSISQRDGAITYRDFVLYDDFKQQNFWFPIANLMTHGIIKGKHESVGIETEPLDKFTDDVLLYFARGVSMYELYISPDILTEGEWTSISQSMAWARDRFPILMNSEMVGGNPLKGEAYAHVHFKEEHGIIAARNPVMDPIVLKIKLDPASGFDPKADSLVLERVYPTRWISPTLYKSGEIVYIHLDGFETAIYEVYPLAAASVPLLAGVRFDVPVIKSNEYKINFYPDTEIKLLNPSFVTSAMMNGKSVNPRSLFSTLALRSSLPAEGQLFSPPILPSSDDKSKFTVRYGITSLVHEGTIAILLTPDTSIAVKTKPIITCTLSGNELTVKTEPQEGKSQWYTVEIPTGKNETTLQIKPGNDEKEWHGTASVWMIGKPKEIMDEIVFSLAREPKEKPMPPLPWSPCEVRMNVKLGEVKIESINSK
jgi:hypothetical protein